jgi:hypothetical protein
VVLSINLPGVDPHSVGGGSHPREDLLLGPGDPLDSLAEVRAIHVAQADGKRASHLVAVAGPDAPQRGADRLAAGALLLDQPVLLEMPGG